jgi:hypothetical protein
MQHVTKGHEMKLSNADRNIIRTAAPAVIGAVVSYITKATQHLTPAETAIIFPIATTAYYTIVRSLEEKFPKASWLLGCLPVKAVEPVEAPATPAEVPATPAPAEAPTETK